MASAEGQPDQGGTEERRRPRSAIDNEANGATITSSADEPERDAPARATPLGN